MSARPRKHVYRQGDEVIITEPRVVLRVGYPLGLADGVKHIEAHAGDVSALLVRLGILSSEPCPPYLVEGEWMAPDDRIVNALAYAWLKAQRFGGRERTIHTELREALRGKRAYVQSKRSVKTGTYNHGSTSYSYDGIPDSEPPYLGNVRSHVLLTLDGGDLRPADTLHDGRSLEIEECHVTPYVAPWMAAEQSTLS
jgi:hypothetical protein